MNRQKELVVINKVLAILVVVLAFAAGYLMAQREEWIGERKEQSGTPVETPLFRPPALDGITVTTPRTSPLISLLRKARFEWEVSEAPIAREDMLTLVWAAQGSITEWGERTAPSYKSKFPLTLTLLARSVDTVDPGYYEFDVTQQELSPLEGMVIGGDEMEGALVLRLSVRPEIVVDRGMMWHEAGAVAQNVLLMSRELGLSAVFMPSEPDGSDSELLWRIFIGEARL